MHDVRRPDDIPNWLCELYAQQMNENGLTPQQERFVAEYLVDLNGTKAAIRAGYKDTSARTIAAQLLAKRNVSEAVKLGTDKLLAKVEITAERVKQELADIAFTKTEDKVKTQHKLDALEKLGKHLGMFKEEKQGIGVHFHFNTEMARELARLAKPIEAEVIEEKA